MAYISRECVSCTHPTKKSTGKFSATDEKGKRFSGSMFECDNLNCPVNRERLKTIKIHTRRESETNAAIKVHYNKCQ